MSDAGFFDAEAAQRKAAKIQALFEAHDQERRSVVSWQVAEILHILDQRIERAVQRTDTIKVHSLGRRIRDIVRQLCGARSIAVDDGAHRRQHPAHSVDLDLQKIEAVLNRRGPIGSHRPSPSLPDGMPGVADDEQPASAAASRHRLSGDPK
jgi:hypothetical protein